VSEILLLSGIVFIVSSVSKLHTRLDLCILSSSSSRSQT